MLAQSICRLCLNENSPLIYPDESLRDQINSLMQIKIAGDTKNWPEHVCGACEDIVVRFIEFKSTCVQNQDEVVDRFGPLEVLTENPLKTEWTGPIEAVPDGESSSEGDQNDTDYESKDDVPFEPEVQITQPTTRKRKRQKPTADPDPAAKNDEEDDHRNEEEGDKSRSEQEALMEDTIHSFMSIQCDTCKNGDSFDNLKDLVRHFKAAHKTKNWYIICPVCKNLFRRRATLHNHILYHKNPLRFSCTICQKGFVNKGILKVHMAQMHDDHVSARQYQCEQCEQRFVTLSMLNIHKKTHIPQEERNFKCDQCHRRFTLQCYLTAHQRQVHLNVKVICEICAKPFRSRGILKEHIQKVHEKKKPTGPKVICTVCEKWFLNQSALNRHMKNIHLDGGTFPCQECNYVAANKRTHRLHVQRMHQSRTTETCNICGKVLKTIRSLKEHLAIHSGDMLYKCLFCPKEFNSNGNKYSHQIKCHPQDYKVWKDRKENLIDD